MKKILAIMFVLCAVNAQAQIENLYVGGNAKLGYAEDTFQFGLLPEVGYEINERWAVGTNVGFTTNAHKGGDTITMGAVGPYARFTAWQCERVAIDVKGGVDLRFGKNVFATEIGFRPSVRFFVNDHYEIAADLGLVGLTYSSSSYTMLDGNGEAHKYTQSSCSPAILLNAISCGVTMAYRF